MTLARTGGLAFEVDDALRGVMTFGWLEADGIRPEELAASFAEERDAICARLHARYGSKTPADIPGIAENRAMFHRLGVDPTKTRPASEALMRRVLQGKGLPAIHPVVDVCNLASLEHQFSLGLYDRDLVRNAVFARVGRVGEGYDGIRKGHVNLSNRPLLADDEGPFGAPTLDSARTQVDGRHDRAAGGGILPRRPAQRRAFRNARTRRRPAGPPLRRHRARGAHAAVASAQVRARPGADNHRVAGRERLVRALTRPGAVPRPGATPLEDPP